MKYNVIIVDNNKQTVESLQNLPFWKELNCDIKRVAYSADEAMRLCQKVPIDLVITDIKMPGIDGLTFAKQLYEAQPDIIVIVISAFDDFALVKKALSLGVFDYVLKPISDDELYNVVKRAVIFMNKNNELHEKNLTHVEPNEFLSPKQKAVARKKEQDALRDFISNHLKVNVDKTVETPFFIQNDNNFLLLTAGLPQLYAHDTEKLTAFKAHMQATCANFINTEMDYFLLTQIEDKFYVLLFFSANSTDEDQKRFIKKLCQEITTLTDTSYRAMCSVSKIHHHTKSITTAIDEANSAYNIHYFNADSHTTYAEDSTVLSKTSSYAIMKKCYALFAILKGSAGDLNEITTEIFNDISNYHNADAQEVKNILICICSNVYQIYIDNTIFVDNNIDLSDIFDKINLSTNLAHTQEIVLNLISSTHEKLQNKSTTAYSKTVADIIDYLNLNYDKKVTLNDIASEFNFSVEHICRLLKKETQTTFTTLFNQIRIKNAERLLHETDMKVYEVASRVGFENYAYFYQTYKKITGRTPSHR